MSKAEQINTYGLRLEPGVTQFDYERMAVAFNIGPEKGGMGEMVHLKNVADKLYPKAEWNPWLERQFESMSRSRWVCWPGAAGCVSGDTKILNPITGEEPTIRELCFEQVSPMVMTINGPAQADIPFVKGTADLYEVRLGDGSVVEGTEEHLLLTEKGWMKIGDLRAGLSVYKYSQSLLDSTSAHDQSVHGEDVHCSQRKVGGYQGDCSDGFRPGGEQLLAAREACQSFSPSPDGVREHSLHTSCSDGSAMQSECNRPLSHDDHPSSFDYLAQSVPLDSHEPRHFDPRTHEHVFQLSRWPLRFEPKTRQWMTCEALDRGYAHKPRSFAASDSQPSIHRDTYSVIVSQAPVVSIRNTGPAAFYDITVPGEHHYFAQGMIHHNSGKTFGAAFFGLLWWLCAPEMSSVIMTSTTGKALRRRGWAELVKLRRVGGLQLTGNFIDSRMIWQARQGDDKNAIIGLAVQSGPDLEKAINNIKGVHPRRLLVIIDEATSTPKAIFDACVNLYAAQETSDFRMLVIGNPFSRLDEMGLFAEPANGWDSVCVDDMEWETGMKMDGTRGLVTRFDAERSPNVIAGKCLYPHLVTLKKLEGLTRGLGSQSPRYWSEVRGFWPPDGLTKTIFTESEIVKMGAKRKWVWRGDDVQVAAGFDPSFGGSDRAVLRFVKWGMTTDAMVGIELGDMIQISTDARLDEPPNFQMAAQVKQQCRLRGVSPDRLGVDASGGGRVFCDILERQWGKVLRIESGGLPTEKMVSYEDRRTAKEAYDRRVTELWYGARECLMSGQLKGLDSETAVELCSRRYEDDRKKICLETKDDYKKRHGKSPDLGDAVCIAIETAKVLGFQVRQTGATKVHFEDEDKSVRAAQKVYEDVDYSGQNEVEMLAQLEM